MNAAVMSHLAAIPATATTAARADFEQIVREHSAMVFSIAWHYLHDRALAEEVAQDVFLQLHRDLDRVEDAGHVKHWLRRVATHRCIDQVRARKTRAQVALEDAPPLAAVEREADPLMSRLLQRLVASLPPQARMMIVLRYQEEMDPMEIAETLGIPARTVRTRLHRALHLLREKAARQQREVNS
ncbi:MAG TPA: sigma-70 family RNA polymerase sigma factor [Bryobacteraceae bacterium]|nr:sigma-70 family RNA polymerase sigma factor [Bryobacterales bacterium]HRJ18581.1 sigma-70 family RNA polymerase sigma factor [Bryobacteraceae bacterium]